MLVDDGRTVMEASIIIEYLGLHHPGPVRLIPADPRAALDVRMMDRFFDNYVMTPMQKIVVDSLRAAADRDRHGVAEARALLDTAYRWLDGAMAGREWAAGEAFSLADCAAAPALFYADWAHPIGDGVRERARLSAAAARAAVLRARGGRGAAVSAALPARRARPRLTALGNAEAAARFYQGRTPNASEETAMGTDSRAMPAGTAETAGAVRGVLEPHLAAGDTPGMVALVGRGEQADAIVLGRLASGAAAPMQRDTLFRIASMTKPVTAAARHDADRGRHARLDEPVDRLLPELADRRVLRRPDAALDDTVPARRPITVEDLLTFRCGLGLIFAPPEQYPILRRDRRARPGRASGRPIPLAAYGPDEWMRRLGELPLMAQPGEQWLYTAGANMLGVLIARATGQPLPATSCRSASSSRWA